ncbi:hypothetical protein JCM11641_008007 [Rhodosporidiobolus odoratus]
MRSPTPPPPVTKLPAEILLLVFSAARDTHDASTPNYSSFSVHHSFARRINPILAVAQVCRSWRALAEEHGELWASLHLDGEIDGERAEEKASFWSEKARRQRQTSADGQVESGASRGVRALYLTCIQDWPEDDFAYLCETLDLVHPFRLEHAHASWLGGGTSLAEHKQLQSFFQLLLPSAPTLASLTLYTPSHLRILFSLPRLGHTFSSLTSLDIRSTKSSTPAPDAYLLPTFLPRYSGEADWSVLSSLRDLTLIGPIWRLRYRDGTVASPTLGAEDVPALVHARLSSTTPQVHWDLLSHSSGTLKSLHLEDWWDQFQAPDPDLLAGSLSRLTSLRLTRSPSLATRLLDLAVQTPGLTWPHLQDLGLASSRLSQAHLELFKGSRAPRLEELDSSDTISAEEDGMLELPVLPALKRLDLFRVGWITPKKLVDSIVFKGQMDRLEVLRSDLALGEVGRRALGSIGVDVLEDELERD